MAKPGIPTTYRGVNFRSRLEARWACMFDLLEWPWEYEPLELAGYIPDFVLMFPRPVLVEVKPSIEEEELRTHRAKIEASGWDREALLLGARLFDCPVYEHGIALGLLAEQDWGDEPGYNWWWEFGLTGWCGGHWGIAHSYGSYVCRVKGCYDGNPPVDYPDRVRDLWIEAGNRTQWNPRRRP